MSKQLVKFTENALSKESAGVDSSFTGQATRLFLARSNSDKTRDFYGRVIKEFALFSKRATVRDVAFNDLLEWRDSMTRRKLSAHTVSSKLAVVSAYFEFFRALGVISANPASAKLLPRPRKPKQSEKGKALTPEEVRYLLYSTQRDNVRDMRDFAVIYLMLHLALRVSEVVNLKNSDIKENKKGFVLDYTSKGGVRERQPLPKAVLDVIDDYLKADDDERFLCKTYGDDSYIFQSTATNRLFGTNQPLTRRHIWHIVKQRGKAAGLGSISPHDLRRTAVTQAFEQKLPIDHIQNMSKHKSIETLMIYNKNRENLDKNAANFISYEF